MSIPETPSNRLEMYLDEIARKGGGGGGGGGSSTLSGLTDVDISNPTDGQTLVYNATSGKWENGESAGGVINIPYTTDDQTGAIILQKTWNEINSALLAGKVLVVVRVTQGDNGPVCLQIMLGGTENTESLCYVFTHSENPDAPVFVSESPSGYPVYEP